jgi:hypothetical protein
MHECTVAKQAAQWGCCLQYLAAAGQQHHRSSCLCGCCQTRCHNPCRHAWIPWIRKRRLCVHKQVHVKFTLLLASVQRALLGLNFSGSRRRRINRVCADVLKSSRASNTCETAILLRNLPWVLHYCTCTRVTPAPACQLGKLHNSNASTIVCLPCARQTHRHVMIESWL